MAANSPDELHPHYPIWFGVAALTGSVAVATVGSYYLKATHFSWVGAPMMAAYVFAGLTALCVLGGVRGWQFPLVSHGRNEPTPTKRNGGLTSGPSVARRAPDKSRGTVGISVSSIHPDGRIMLGSSKVPGPRVADGNLPLVVDLHHVQGERGGQDPTNQKGTHWAWTFEDLVLVNESDDPITCVAWLLVDTTDSIGWRELRPSPNRPICIPAREFTQVTLTFTLDFVHFDDDAKSNPGSARELVLLEVGSLNRELRIPLRAS